MNLISKQQAKGIDKFAQTKLGISTLLLMENAGRNIADVALNMRKGRQAKVALFCGKGNNGGDGFVAARHLAIKGIDIDVYLAAEYKDVKNEARVNLDILKALGINVKEILDKKIFDNINFEETSLIIDALLGIGLSGEVKGIIRDTIYFINKSRIPVLSIDIPSGLDADTGKALGLCISATKTVTFVAKKLGMVKNHGTSCCGEVIISDIGFPLGMLNKALI